MQTDALADMIVVIPNAYNTYAGSFYVNSPVTGNWQDFISDDLISYVDGHFRTLAVPASRGVTGYGMGAFGALRLVIEKPDVFGAVYAMSPCCLDWADDLSETNPYWRRALQMSHPRQLEQAWQRGDAYLNLFTAMGAAFSPDLKRPPFHIDWPLQTQREKQGSVYVRERTHNHGHGHGAQRPTDPNQLVPREPAYDHWQHNFPVNMVADNRANLAKLNGIVLDYGAQDGPAHVPSGAQAFSRTLAKSGIAHQMNIYEGTLIPQLRDRLAKHVLPFFAHRLSFAATQ